MRRDRTTIYTSRFGDLRKLGRIKAGSLEERFARHRYRFAGLEFDLSKHNHDVGYDEWKRAQYAGRRERNAEQQSS